MLGAVDGVLGVALPFAALAVLAVVAWAGLGGPGGWTPFIRAAAVVQLLGHGVDVRFAAPGGAFTATVALLGPALVTAVAAVRAGRRAAATASPLAAWAAGGIATAACCAGLLVTASSDAARPVAWQALVLPTALVAAVSLLALRPARSRPLPPGVRTGLAAAAMLAGAGALLTAVLLVVRFADVIALYEGLAPGATGGLVLTAAQVLALPTLVVWTSVWTTGAGIALGAGSVTGAFSAQVGPLPAVPLLGVVPQGAPAAAAAAVLLVPVLVGFAAGAVARRTGATGAAVPLGLVAGATAGAVAGAVAAAASGSAGPGRLSAVGPDPWLTALLVAAEIGLPVVIAAAVVRPRAPATAPGPDEADH